MENPAMQPVISSNVTEIGYEASTGKLSVRFKTGVLYTYSGVPQQEFTDLMSASSVGSYLAQHIKKTYPCEQVG